MNQEKFKAVYYPEEISEAMLAIGGSELDCKPEELQQALYEIKTIAENPYNSDYWRTLYYALERMAEVYEQNERCKRYEREEQLRRKPRVIVEIKGGAMTDVYADAPVEIDLMDYDNLEAADSEEEYESMLQEFADWNDEIKARTLWPVW